MNERILVVNPNSTQSITDHMSAALENFRLPGGPQFVCETLACGPAGIETQAHVDAATGQLLAWFDAVPERKAAAAMVIGCFSDPGLVALRQSLKMPVFGMGESSYLTAAAMAEQFGIVAAVQASIGRHKRALRLLGLEHKLAGDIALDLPVASLGEESVTWNRLCQVGVQLRDDCGANAIVMGCAGLARYRRRLEDFLGVAIVDPTQAAAGMALGAVLTRRAALGSQRAAA
jgi:allantoin racemase